jgi:hypothetical protein
MREQFDKKLANKIKSSFKHFEGEYDASEWDKFSKVYFTKKEKPAAIWIKWLSGIAAVAILGFSIYTIIQPSQIATPEKNMKIAQNTKESDETFSKKSIIEDSKSSEANPSEKNDSKVNQIPILTPKENLTQKVQKEEIKPTLSQSTDVLEKKTIISPLANENEPSKLNNDLQPNITIADNIKPQLNVTTEPLGMSSQEAIEQIKEWKGEPTIASNQTILKENNSNEPVKIGILVAPQTISNSTQSINFGAGLMSELSFSKKLKLDVGMAYAYQNISPTSGDNILMSSAANDVGSESLRAATFTGNVINATRELSFGQLEIPINLKYKVMDKKESGIYLISGLSNMVYLNQKDVTTFSTANLATANFASNHQMLNTYNQTVKPSNQTSGLDTGRMLNFGVGFEQNLKNGTYLSIEPFYKLPLGDQTFTNQQFSMGGINLRMNFQLKSKKE